MARLTGLLTEARKRKGLTLRAVEAKTGISNAYLSQIETGKVKEPSPLVLHKLSHLYGIPYTTTLLAAGYPVPGFNGAMTSPLAARIGATTREEEDALVEYLEFLRSRRTRENRP